jgi:methylenetetrahydrofolate reductase (NADPH)
LKIKDLCLEVKKHNSLEMLDTMHLRDITFSFEFFPPQDLNMNNILWETIKNLEYLSPCLASITYGARGTTRKYTFDTALEIKNHSKMTPMPHLTCIGLSKENFEELADKYWENGIIDILALRGDIPEDNLRLFSNSPYKSAKDLTLALSKRHKFNIGVAAYPEGHPESKSFIDDINYLKEKIDSGANKVFTQFFFNIDAYKKFIDKGKFNVSIIPGILPVSDFKKMVEFANKCGSKIPDWMFEIYDGVDINDKKLRYNISTALSCLMCKELYDLGVRHFHFFTLNRFELTKMITSFLLD